MKNMKSLFLICLSVLCSTAVFAQEQTGHGRFHRQPRQQQQQQQRMLPLKLVVIEGDEAETEFAYFSKYGVVTDQHSHCSEPVLEVRFGRSTDYYADRCFDRGVSFQNGTRFKCYISRRTHIGNEIQRFIFRKLHNECGGDGVYPVR